MWCEIAGESHIEDGEVEEDKDELQADPQQALQLAHNGARVLQRVCQIAAVVIDLQHRLLQVLRITAGSRASVTPQ